MVVVYDGQGFVFKMAKGEGDSDSAAQLAIKQMRYRGYTDKYRNRGEPIHLVGVAFSLENGILVAVKGV